MIGILFATIAEARPFLSLSRATVLAEGPLLLYQSDMAAGVLAAVSGMGKIAAAVACQILIRERQITHVINAGVCGALNPAECFGPGSLFRIEAVTEGDPVFAGKELAEYFCAGRWGGSLPGARLVTCDQPVFDLDRRAILAAKGDLADMEGAAVARVAAFFNVPWTLIKGVTDTAGPNDRRMLLHNLEKVSGQIACFLWQELREMS